MKRVKIVADSKIPFLRGVLEPHAEVVYLSPDKIDAEAVRDADALIIRTRTRCDASLLEGSAVKMIATATIGYDHIDRAYCASKGIEWRNAPGCNAASVGQYVLSAVSLLMSQRNDTPEGKTLGIVGVGNVGKAVERVCRIAGMKILRNDPPRALAEGAEGFVDLETIARESDVITFHTPLVRGGDYPTMHLADERFFDRVANTPVIINAARGEVIDERAMMRAYDEERISEMIIDCWEHEPKISRELLAKSYLSTPHIAGYSADGKSNATRMAVENIARFFGWEVDLSPIQAPGAPNPEIDASQFERDARTEVLLHTYDPREDSARLREDPERFEQQRGDYPLRREYGAYTIYGVSEEDRGLFTELGFTVMP